MYVVVLSAKATARGLMWGFRHPNQVIGLFVLVVLVWAGLLTIL